MTSQDCPHPVAVEQASFVGADGATYHIDQDFAIQCKADACKSCLAKAILRLDPALHRVDVVHSLQPRVGPGIFYLRGQRI